MNWIEKKTLGLFVKTQGRISNIVFGGVGHIFMLHRILPENLRNTYTINRDLAITPSHLEDVIIYLKKKKYKFVSLDELHATLINNTKQDHKYICFTIDDGYKDNLEYGFPIFQKHNIPITIYVTNGLPNHSAILWWYLLEGKIENNKTVRWNKNTYTWNNESEKQNIYQLLRNDIKALNKTELSSLTNTFFNKTSEELKQEVQKLALSWTEIKELSNEKIVTIGAHTMNHLSLRNLSPEEIAIEIGKSKSELEEKTEKKIEHFAYPYGGFEDASTREYLATKKAGFKTSVLNHPGNVFTEHKNALMALPRYPLGNGTTQKKLEHYLNGIQHFSVNSFRKTIKY